MTSLALQHSRLETPCITFNFTREAEVHNTGSRLRKQKPLLRPCLAGPFPGAWVHLAHVTSQSWQELEFHFLVTSLDSLASKRFMTLSRLQRDLDPRCYGFCLSQVLPGPRGPQIRSRGFQETGHPPPSLPVPPHCLSFLGRIWAGNSKHMGCAPSETGERPRPYPSMSDHTL